MSLTIHRCVPDSARTEQFMRCTPLQESWDRRHHQGLSVFCCRVGYNTATAYDEKVVNGIYTITCIVPAAGFVLLALSLWFLYPLGKTKVEENARILKERRDRSGM